MAATAYHASFGTHSRSRGESAVASAAYRSASCLHDERTGITHDFTRKRGVEHAEIIAPENAPEWANDRSRLWNEAEAANTRKNSTVDRELLLSFPASLNLDERRDMARQISRELVERHGCAVDFAMHEPGREGSERNYHVHVLMTTHRLGREGFEKKTRELDDKSTGAELVVYWRARWAELCGQALEKAGERVEAGRWAHGHLRLQEQAKQAHARGDTEFVERIGDRVPTIHLGKNVIALERKGVLTERGDAMREIQQRNATIIDLAEARKRIEAWRESHERNDGNRADRHAARGVEQDAGRAGTGERGRDAAESDIGRVGRVPPPFARGRLRNLSELGVVRFEGRGEVLLPRDVSGDVEHGRAERNQALRRNHDGLTATPEASREAIQRAANDATLRALKSGQSAREPAKVVSPETIKAEWQVEKDRQFALVADKARRVQGHAAGQMERQEGRMRTHDHARPQEPAGLLASFKRAAFEQAVTAWQGVRAGLEKRFLQLRNRLNVIGEYTRRAGPYELATRGEKLAERKAEQARPELAENFRQVIEREKAAAIERNRAKIAERQQQRQERTRMKQESIEELKQRTDANRARNEQAERNRLEAAGRQAAMQSPLDPAQKLDVDQAASTQAGNVAKALNELGAKPEKTKEERAKEILDQFRAKKAKEREDNDRGRGGNSR